MFLRSGAYNLAASWARGPYVLPNLARACCQMWIRMACPSWAVDGDIWGTLPKLLQTASEMWMYVSNRSEGSTWPTCGISSSQTRRDDAIIPARSDSNVSSKSNNTALIGFRLMIND